MSRLIFTLMLNEVLSKSGLRVSLSESEKDRLYMELLNYFGLAGGLNVCEALESAWQDPYNKERIEEFIVAWLRRKMRKNVLGESATGII
ncbi:MAG: hypothetical protein QXR06_00800 [Candidatus Bathyarchaeia archaeon]|nr:hypothetical protein [Candidatus Bathyarchaeota archaeon]